MLIAIEHSDSPVCEIISRNQPDSGVAFLPAVAIRFLLQPRELRLQYQNGRLRYDFRPDTSDVFRHGPDDAVCLYQKIDKLLDSEPKETTNRSLNELA